MFLANWAIRQMCADRFQTIVLKTPEKKKRKRFTPGALWRWVIFRLGGHGKLPILFHSQLGRYVTGIGIQQLSNSSQ